MQQAAAVRIVLRQLSSSHKWSFRYRKLSTRKENNRCSFPLKYLLSPWENPNTCRKSINTSNFDCVATIPTEWKQELDALQNRIGITFTDYSLLQSAMTDAAFFNRLNNEGREIHHPMRMSNCSLETLGDSILGFVVTSYLFQAYPEALEGEITNRKRAIVSNDTLASVAIQEQLQLDVVLLGTSKSHTSNGRRKLFAASVEALIGAIFVDQGMESATKFVHSYVLPFARSTGSTEADDPISILQMKTHRFNPKLNVTYIKHEDGAVSAKIGSMVLATEKQRNYKLGRVAAATSALEVFETVKEQF